MKKYNEVEGLDQCSTTTKYLESIEWANYFSDSVKKWITTTISSK